jgi:hypothetical protein
MTALCAEEHRICKVTLVIRILPDFASQVLGQMRQVAWVYGDDFDSVRGVGGHFVAADAVISRIVFYSEVLYVHPKIRHLEIRIPNSLPASVLDNNWRLVHVPDTTLLEKLRDTTFALGFEGGFVCWAQDGV